MCCFNTLLQTQKLHFLNGVYCYAELHSKSAEKLHNFCITEKINNHLFKHEMHCTIIYDRLPHDDFSRPEVYTPPLEVMIDSFDLFNVNSTANALVLKLKSDELINKHNKLAYLHSIEHDFDEYIPHITLSYDAQITPSELKSLNSKLDIYKRNNDKLFFVAEVLKPYRKS